MAGQDVLDQCEPEAGAALGPALADIDPVETLGQAGNILRCDAGPLVAHFQHPIAVARRHFEPYLAVRLAFFRRAVFDGVLDQIFGHPQQLVAVAPHQRRFDR